MIVYVHKSAGSNQYESGWRGHAGLPSHLAPRIDFAPWASGDPLSCLDPDSPLTMTDSLLLNMAIYTVAGAPVRER